MDMSARKQHDMRSFHIEIDKARNRLYRDMPWRTPEADGSFDPYKILVSEIMLQQTQVRRVVSKYNDFLNTFPDIYSLAAAPLKDVLIAWNGLGYNRRAKFLHEAAKTLAASENWSVETLVGCMGVGPNTAAAIRVYAYNEPLVFIETNIRTVFLHYFFADRKNVPDKDIVHILAAALSGQEPRTFYWALMDLGAEIKKTDNPNVRSRSYSRQSRFVGSLRQLRGKIIRELMTQNLSLNQVLIAVDDDRAKQALASLVSDGLVEKIRGRYRLVT